MEDQYLNATNLDIKDGDTIVVHSDSITQENLYKIYEGLNKDYNNIKLIRLNSCDKIESLSELEMNRLGWFRKE